MTDDLKKLAEAAKAALPGMEWTAHMSRLHLTASPQGSTCLNDEVTLALCATGEHVYQVLPYLAAANPTAILAIIRERDEARERAERFEKLDREAATYVESVIALRTGFTGDPPYVGWKGLGLALTEALDKRDAAEAALSAAREEVERLRLTVGHRDRRIARLVSALNDAREQGFRVPADNEPKLTASATLTKEPTDVG